MSSTSWNHFEHLTFPLTFHINCRNKSRQHLPAEQTSDSKSCNYPQEAVTLAVLTSDKWASPSSVRTMLIPNDAHVLLCSHPPSLFPLVSPTAHSLQQNVSIMSYCPQGHDIWPHFSALQTWQNIMKLNIKKYTNTLHCIYNNNVFFFFLFQTHTSRNSVLPGSFSLPTWAVPPP